MIRVTFLGAVGRSGTTLIERTLASGGGFVALGEVCHFWSRSVAAGELCGCGTPIRECEVWTRIVDRAFGGWDRLDATRIVDLQRSVDRNRLIPLLMVPRLGSRAFRSSLHEYAGLLTTLFAAMAAEFGQDRVLVDSSKHPSSLFVLRHVRGVDVRVLQVVRDPRAVAHSWSKVVPRVESADGEPMEQLGPVRATARWTSHHLLFRLAALRFPTRRLGYEQFAAEPDQLPAAVQSLWASDGVRCAPIPDGRVELGVDHTISGNPVRFSTGALVIRPDEAWRRTPGGIGRALVGLVTFPLRSVLGR